MKLHDWNAMLEEPLNPQISRRAIHASSLTVARLSLARGAVVPTHQHINEQVSLIESGRLLFRIGGEEIVVAAGQALEIPPNVPHSAEALEDTVAVDVFS